MIMVTDDNFPEAVEIPDDAADVGRDDQPIFATGAQRQMEEELRQYTDRSPTLSGGDVDAAWQDSDVGEESVGGGNPTPDQDIVEEIGEAFGITYQDNEPLGTEEKLEKRDDDRWELDPASAEDFNN